MTIKQMRNCHVYMQNKYIHTNIILVNGSRKISQIDR